MLLIKNLDRHEPFFNLAAEEYVLEIFKDFFKGLKNHEIIMFWQNDCSVILGLNQNAYSEINLDYANKNNIVIARRKSGGGCVYHDLGNVNFSYFSRINNEENNVLNFKYFTSPIIDALKNLGITASLAGRNDLLIDGAKFSGNAQRIYKNKIMHHGTLLFDSNLDELSKVLNANANEEKIKSKSIKSVRSRVINIKEKLINENNCDLNNFNSKDFLNYLEDYFVKFNDCKVYNFTSEDIKNIEIIAEKYADKNFIFGNKIDYNFKNKKRFDFGSIEINFDVEKNFIANLKIYGDFFGELNIKDLEDLLNSNLHNYNVILEVLSKIDLDKYIKGCKNCELAELFL